MDRFITVLSSILELSILCKGFAKLRLKFGYFFMIWLDNGLIAYPLLPITSTPLLGHMIPVQYVSSEVNTILILFNHRNRSPPMM